MQNPIFHACAVERDIIHFPLKSVCMGELAFFWSQLFADRDITVYKGIALLV